MKLKNKTRKKKIKSKTSKTEMCKTRRMKGGVKRSRGDRVDERAGDDKGHDYGDGVNIRKRLHRHDAASLKNYIQGQSNYMVEKTKYTRDMSLNTKEQENLLTLYWDIFWFRTSKRDDLRFLKVDDIHIYIKYKNCIVNNNRIIEMKTP